MSTATVTSKGQITIPKEVRKTRPENVDLMSLFGIFKPRVKNVTLEDMKEAIRAGAAGE